MNDRMNKNAGGNIPILRDIVKRGDKAPDVDVSDDDITQPRYQATQNLTQATDPQDGNANTPPDGIEQSPSSADSEITVSDLTQKIEDELTTDIEPLIEKVMEKAVHDALLNLQPILEDNVRNAVKVMLQEELTALKKKT